MKQEVAKPKHKAFKSYEPVYLYGGGMRNSFLRCYMKAHDVIFSSAYIVRFNGVLSLSTKPKPQPMHDVSSVILTEVCPMAIYRILADNSKELTDRFFGLRQRIAIGKYAFGLCAELDRKQRLSPPMPRKQTIWLSDLTDI